MSKAPRPGLFSTLRDDILAAGFEFVGTTFWLLLGLGGIQTAYNLSGDTRFSIGHNFYVAASMGLSLMAAAWIFFRATGGLFNPNVSLALVLVGAIGPVRFVLYSIAQFLGAIAAAGLVQGLLPGDLDVECVSIQNVLHIEHQLTLHLAPTCRLTQATFEVYSSKCSLPQPWLLLFSASPRRSTGRTLSPAATIMLAQIRVVTVESLVMGLIVDMDRAHRLSLLQWE